MSNRGRPRKQLRNKAIVDLRNFDSDYWSFAKIGKAFGLKRQTVRYVYRRDSEEKEG